MKNSVPEAAQVTMSCGDRARFNSALGLPDATHIALVSTDNGFDDYAVHGVPGVHRICVGQGIKEGDAFNVYCSNSVKLCGVWQTNLLQSLATFVSGNGVLQRFRASLNNRVTMPSAF